MDAAAAWARQVDCPPGSGRGRRADGARECCSGAGLDPVDQRAARMRSTRWSWVASGRSVLTPTRPSGRWLSAGPNSAALLVAGPGGPRPRWGPGQPVRPAGAGLGGSMAPPTVWPVVGSLCRRSLRCLALRPLRSTGNLVLLEQRTPDDSLLDVAISCQARDFPMWTNLFAWLIPPSLTWPRAQDDSSVHLAPFVPMTWPAKA